jgi:hypothetical protein
LAVLICKVVAWIDDHALDPLDLDRLAVGAAHLNIKSENTT